MDPQLPIRTRHTDPDNYEETARQQRLVDPRYWDLQLKWGTREMNIRGLTIAIAFIAAVNVSAVLWSGYQTKVAVGESVAALSTHLNDMNRKSVDDHQALRRSTDRNTCMLAMSQNRREQFLERSGSPGAWGQVCPFIQGE